MFDVAWTDPTIETNAQHRQRREREVTKGGARRSSVKSGSSSGASSKAQTTSRSGWGLFGNAKKASNSKAPASSGSKSSLSLSTKNEVLMSGGKSGGGGSSDDFMSRDRNIDDDLRRQPEPISPGATTVSNFSGGDSTFSGGQSRYNATDSSWGGSVSGSKTYDTDSRISNTLYQDDYFIDRSMSELHLSHQDDIPEDLSDTYNSFPISNHQSRSSGRPSQLQIRPSSRNRLQDRDMESSSRYAPSRSSSRLDERPFPPPSIPLPNPHYRPESQAQSPEQPVETTFQRSVRRMEAASAKIILERLREEWDEVADASIYKELELDKKLWMLAGWKFLLARKEAKDDIAALSRGSSFSVPSTPVAGRVLSLYEKQASAIYLSTTHPLSEIHHPSATPCTGTQIPLSRFRGIIISTPISALPYSPSTFKSISCFPLCSILPSPSIPVLLKECYRVLEPRGTIKLTLMDPIPVVSTMGPITQKWFDEYLVLKLETQFRCLKPTRLVPVWLQDVGFSVAPTSKTSSLAAAKSPAAAGSSSATEGKSMTMAFPAVARGEGGYRLQGAAKRDPAAQNKRDMELLTATVGRMLWKEMWGEYVVGRRWWWEDERVVEECGRLRTRWDVVVIEGVKGA